MAEFEEYIRRGHEARDLEYKQGGPWSGLRDAITKTALGMANVRDGGTIVIGVAVAQGGGYTLTGITDVDLRTYSEDGVREFVGTFADPHVALDVHRVSLDNRWFLVIVVHEFELLPVITRKESADIRRGALYTRTMQPATIQVPDSFQLREILDLATRKLLRRQLEWLERTGAPIGRADLRGQLERFSEERMLDDVLNVYREVQEAMPILPEPVVVAGRTTAGWH